MAHAFLRSAPADDKRPDPFCDAVLMRATLARLDEIRAWLKPRWPTELSEAEVKFALMAAMKASGADGFRASVKLLEVFHWPVDMELCQYIRDTCNALAFALRVETRVWGVRVGIRFPAKSEDRIEWRDEQGRPMSGKVISTDASLGIAIVQRFDGTVRMGAPVRVLAETVVANLTQKLYGDGTESRLPEPDPTPCGEVLLIQCPACKGERVIPLPGQDMIGEDCPHCDGMGVIEP
jgi:hypothetical protein